MKRRTRIMLVLMVLVVGSLFILAQPEQQDQEQPQQEVNQEQPEQECGFWCKVGKFSSGEGREKVVGEIT